MGSRGGEDSSGCGGTETGGVWDKWRSPSTSRPCGPTFAQINQEGRTQSGGERGSQSAGSTPESHTRAQINRDERWGAKQTM